MSTSALQTKLSSMLADIVPALDGAEYTWGFERTRTQNPNDAKWVFTAKIAGRKKPLLIKSLVPARDITKTACKLVVISETPTEVWVGMQPNVDGVIAQLKAAKLWVPRVEKAIAKTLAEQGAQ